MSPNRRYSTSGQPQTRPNRGTTQRPNAHPSTHDPYNQVQSDAPPQYAQPDESNAPQADSPGEHTINARRSLYQSFQEPFETLQQEAP